jgi:hypothetical protein
MDVHEALEAWQAQYSSQPPVGFMLRFTHEAVWTRVHYLRDSGEAATREEDERTAARFDAVASALFTGTTVLLLAIHLDPQHEATDELRYRSNRRRRGSRAWGTIYRTPVGPSS